MVPRPASPVRGGAAVTQQTPAAQEQERGGYRVGQRLWCRDDDHHGRRRGPWQRGVVTGFGKQTAGPYDRWGGQGATWSAPLVRVTEGLDLSTGSRVWSTSLDEEPWTFHFYDAAEHPGYLFAEVIHRNGLSYRHVARATNGQLQRSALL